MNASAAQCRDFSDYTAPKRGRDSRSALLIVLFIGALWPAAAAWSQEQAEDLVRKAIVERQQQSDAFSLQLRQSQQRLNAAPEQQPAIDTQQLQQRQRLENLNVRQILDLQSATIAAPSWGPRLDSEPQRLQQQRSTELDRGVGRN